LWQVLSWEQGTVVLTSPELLNWVYQLQRQTVGTRAIAPFQQHLSDILQLLTQPVVHLGCWLWDELDELAQELSWVLLPNIAPASAMRSPTEEFEAIVNELQ